MSARVLQGPMRYEEVSLRQPKRCPMQLQVPWFKPAAWGVVVGVVATMIGGFSWLGWTLGSTAERMAVERTSAAHRAHSLLRRQIHAAAGRGREAGRIPE